MATQEQVNEAFENFAACVARSDHHGESLNHADMDTRRRASWFFCEAGKATEASLVALEEMGYTRAEVWAWYQA